GHVIRNLGVGARYIWQTPILRSMTSLRTPVMVVFGLQNVLLLPFAITVLHASEFEYGLQEGITSIGFVVGSLLMAHYAQRLREGSWLVISFLGMGKPAAEWRRTLALLRTAPRAALGAVRPVRVADIAALERFFPALAEMSQRDRDDLVAFGRVVTADAGTAITRAGDTGDSAFFILSGRLAAGVATGDGEYRSLASIGAGDVIGEIAALTGSARTADVVAEEETELLEVPATTPRQLMALPDFGSL